MCVALCCSVFEECWANVLRLGVLISYVMTRYNSPKQCSEKMAE